MQMEKRDLGEDYEAFVEQAGTMITANLINGSFEESEYGVIQLKTGEKLVKGFPFTEVLISRHEEVVRAPLWDEDGNLYDIISGTFFLCAAPPDAENFQSLSEEQLLYYEERFRCPEMFLNVNGKLVCLPVSPI